MKNQGALTLSGLNSVAANYPTIGASETRSQFEAAIITFRQLRPGYLYDKNEIAPHAQVLIDASECWRNHFWTDVCLDLIRAGKCTLARRSYHRRPL